MSTTRTFDLSGGHAALDFANTAAWRQPGETRRDHLASYADLVEWGRQSGLVDDAEAARLLAAAERQPDRAGAVLEEAKRVRESIFEAFAGLAAGVPVKEEALAGLNASLPAALSHLQLESAGEEEGVVWTWSAEPALDRVLWPVVRAAGDLLTSDSRNRVRECASDTCGWLFIDESRNHSRRWCDMKVCGNRDKVRRYRGRER